LIALTTIVSGILLTAQMANATTTEEDSALTTQLSDTTATATGDANITSYAGWIQGNMGPMGPGRHGGPGGRCNGWGQSGFVEVSAEYEKKVMNIANNDSDVQQLLSDGYNATGVMPIIKTVIDADGNLVTKATSAVVMLQKDTEGAAGVASVLVDLESSKVTQIVVLTRTVIDKS
jgi:hypothetical protein